MWWGVVIAGMALLAGCIGAAMLSPDRAGRRELRPLAHVDRLTRLPEYVRALRRRMLSVIVVIFLLAVGFTAALWTTARPAGLPNIASASAAGQPEDIMVCVGESAATPAVAQTLEYFAQRVGGFGTTRVGLTSANVRVVPLTRDHQHAAARFTAYAHSADPGAAPAAFVAPVRYADYAATVEDVLALCLTGFPEFDEPAGQRRSLVYVGPGTLGENRGTPSLFSAEQVRELATTAGIRSTSCTRDRRAPSWTPWPATPAGRRRPRDPRWQRNWPRSETIRRSPPRSTTSVRPSGSRPRTFPC